MDVRFFQLLRICLVVAPISNSAPAAYIAYLKCEHIVREDNHLVSPVLVVLDKELTRLEFSWVHTVK
jgi:hypothetical protein